MREEKKKKGRKEKKKRIKRGSLKVGPEPNGVNCLLSHICHLGLTLGQGCQKTC